MRFTTALICALGMLFALANASIADAAPVIAGPHASAPEIRAVRGAGPAPVRRLVFADARDGKAPGELKVDLAPDYVRMTEPERDVIFDFKLRRLLRPSASERAFVNTSLFADLAFRVYGVERLRHSFGQVTDDAADDSGAVGADPSGRGSDADRDHDRR